MLSEKGKRLRRCQAFTLGGYGPRCKHYSESYNNFCNHHNGKVKIYSGEGELAFRLPSLRSIRNKKTYKHLACYCSAYPFPHLKARGLCLWPDPPEFQLVITDRTNNEETKLKKKLRKMGIHNKATNCIKKRTSDVRPITDHKPEDFTLEADYLAMKAVNVERLRIQNRYDDFSSLPIEEKRRIWKDQILAEFYKKYPHYVRGSKSIEIEVEEEDSEEDHTPTQNKRFSRLRKLRYRVVKDKYGNPFMILEDGTRIPLSEDMLF